MDPVQKKMSAARTFGELFATIRWKGDIHLVEDIFQDTFLTAYRELSESRPVKR